MKKFILIALLFPLFVFGQTKLIPNQLGSGVNKVFVTDANGRGKSDSLDWVASTKTLANGVLSINHTVDTIVGVGNSLTFGTQLQIKPQQTWLYQLGNYLGYKTLNLGVAGTTTASYGLANVPYKYTHRKYVFIEFGYNDVSSLGSDTATFHSNYNTLVNQFIARGWSGNQLYFLSICGVSAQASGRGTNQINFNTVIQQVATHYGSTYIDMYNSFQLPVYGGIALLSVDQTHPNPRGAVIYAKIIESALNSPNFCFDCTTPSAALNTIEANTITFKNTKAAQYTSRNLSFITLDSLNNAVAIPAAVLVDSAKSGAHFILGGSTFQYGAPGFTYLPASGTGTAQFNYAQDIGLLQNTKFVSGINGGLSPGASFNMFTTGGLTELRNYSAGGNFNFYSSGGSNGGQFLALNIAPSGLITTGGALQIAQNSDIQAGPSIGSVSARINVFTSSGYTIFTNYYHPGKAFQFFTAPVTSGSVVQALWIPPSGDMIIGSKTQDDGYGLNVQTTSKIEGNASFGVLATASLSGTPSTSTTGGTLAAATYFYQVVAVDAFGNETSPYSGEYSKTTTGSTSTVTLPTFTASPNATSYHIYQGTVAGAEGKYFTSTTNVGVTDIGSGYTTKALPTQNQTNLANISSVGVGNFQTLNAGVAGAIIGTYTISGNTSGTISIKPQAAAGTYEFDLPITAGIAGQALTSQGGAGTAMTWTSSISKPHTIFTPTTGGTISLTNNQYNIINPAGSLLALTVNLPSSPSNNDTVYIKYTQAVTTVTYGNGTVVDGITSPISGGLVILVYDSGTTSWY